MKGIFPPWRNTHNIKSAAMETAYEAPVSNGIGFVTKCDKERR